MAINGAILPFAWHRACWRLAILASCLLLFAPPAFLADALKAQKVRRFCVRGFFVLLMLLWGMRVTPQGKPAGTRPLLIATNHSSYADVFVLGALAAMRFTPKSDIASWPVVGRLTKLAEVVFIERKRQSTEDNLQAITDALASPLPVCLFPEGTTDDGVKLLPFHSGMFAVAERVPGLTVQPAAIVYRKMGGLPLTGATRPLIAWVGDQTFAGHAFRLLGLPALTVEVRWLSPIPAAGKDRKTLAKLAEAAISEALTVTSPAATRT